MNNKSNKINNSILELIGMTPMLKLNRLSPKTGATIAAKVESFNPGGSIKDRIALHMVNDAEERGLLKPGSAVVEPTSGNTGIGLAMVCAVKGYRLILVMPASMSVERRKLLKAYGAEFVLTPPEEGMDGAIKKAEELAKTCGYFMPMQFDNPINPFAHETTTAIEILKQTDGRLDAFVATVVRRHLYRISKKLKAEVPHIKTVAVEPASSAVLSGAAPGPHKIQGIGAGFVPKVLDTDLIDEIIAVTDEDAYEMTRKLSTEKESLPVSHRVLQSGQPENRQRLGPG